MPWRTVAHFQQQRENPPSPAPPTSLVPLTPTMPPSLDAPGAALSTTTEVFLC